MDSKNQEIISGPFTRIKWERLNLNSPDQIKTYLLQKGWQPDEWNYKKDKATGFTVKDEEGNPVKTSPKLSESSFHTVSGDVPRLITERAVLMHRKRLIDNTRKDGEEAGLLTMVRDDGRIEARAITNATNTGRMIHRQIVNIPSVGSMYGEEFRKLFITPEGYYALGIDAAALEARCQAHYLYPFEGGAELADLLINGDIHESNAELWGVTRKQAKSPYYCLMYGGQPAKLAMTMGCSLKEASGYYEGFWNHYKPLAQFKEVITDVWKKRGGKKGGFLKGLDGRKLFARSPHALVNMMFQSSGSILCKTAAAFMDKAIKKEGLDCTQIIFMHDELEYEVLTDHAERAKVLAEQSFKKAGEFWNLNVPLVGEGKIGKSWYSVH